MKSKSIATDGSVSPDETFESREYVRVDGSSQIGAELQGRLAEVCDECVECEDDGPLAEYGFACIEEVDGECVDHDFGPERTKIRQKSP